MKKDAKNILIGAGIILGVILLVYLNGGLLSIYNPGELSETALVQATGRPVYQYRSSFGCFPTGPYADASQLSTESTFELGPSTFKIVTSNIRPIWLNPEQTLSCAGLWYDSDIYKDGVLIDKIRPDSLIAQTLATRICSGNPAIKKTYSAGISSVDITFGDFQDTSGSYIDRGCAQTALVGHKIILNQPSDIFTATVKKAELSSDKTKLNIIIGTNAKYDSYEGTIGLIINVPSILGNQQFKAEMNKSFNGEQESIFTLNLTDKGEFTITPYYKIYAPTTRLTNLYGWNIFNTQKYTTDPQKYGTEQIPVYASNQYRLYLIKEGQGNSFKTSIDEDVKITQTTQCTTYSVACDNSNPDVTHIKNYNTIYGIILLIVIIMLIVFFIRRRK